MLVHSRKRSYSRFSTCGLTRSTDLIVSHGLETMVVFSLEIITFHFSCVMGGTYVSNCTLLSSSTAGHDMMYAHTSCAMYAFLLVSIAVVQAQASL